MEPRNEALAERFEAALERIGAFFMASSPVQNAAVEIARRLSDMGIDYAIAGALCLAAHGVVRATEDVDVLITRDGLARFKESWLGRGYVDVRPGGKNVRDSERREDRFPDRRRLSGRRQAETRALSFAGGRGRRAGRFRIVDLPRFIELKLASGMTAPHRLQDLADVLRLIGAALPASWGRRWTPTCGRSTTSSGRPPSTPKTTTDLYNRRVNVVPSLVLFVATTATSILAAPDQAPSTAATAPGFSATEAGALARKLDVLARRSEAGKPPREQRVTVSEWNSTPIST